MDLTQPTRHTGRWLLAALIVISAALLLALAVPAQAHEDDPTDEDDSGPTYWHDVRPLLEANCTTCHTDDGIAGFGLGTYEEAVAAAPSIAESVMTRYMPPWPPGGDTPALAGDRSLDQAAIDTLVRWAFTVEEGDPADFDHATLAAPVAVPELRADLTLEMPVEYTPDDTLSDDYRCFLIDPGLDEDRFVTGYNIVPGNPAVVHHVLLYKVPGSARAQAAALEAQDGQPGWQCFGGPRVTSSGIFGGPNTLSNSASLAGSIGAWAPGTPPMLFPEGTGDLLRADDLIVMQVHYYVAEGTQPDRTRAVFQISDPGEPIMALGAINLVAPVELRCADGVDSELCSRDAAIRAAAELDGPRARMRADGLLSLCDAKLADYANQDPASITSDCIRQVPVDGFAIGAAGHMHELGTIFDLTLNAGTPAEQTLLHIPAWDFHWQSGYTFVEPIPVSAGDTVAITCTWDNRFNDRYVVWGESTEDEMCLGGVTILPLPGGMTHAEFRAAHPELFPQDAPMAHADAGSHSHAPLELGPGDVIPTLTIRALDDGQGGHVLLLDVTGFRFAPESVDESHVPGEGHAHLYIDGVKVGRIYSSAHTLPELAPGTHEITVTLNANNHAELWHDGAPISATLTLEVAG
ncbi:MAG: hypothetical protein ACOCXZ_03865 [Chloroflexota bacterium]